MKANKRTHKTTSKVNTKKLKRPAPKAQKGVSAKTNRPAHPANTKAGRNVVVRKSPVSVKKTIEMKSVAHDKADHVKKDDGAKKAAMGLPAAAEAKEAIDALMHNEKGITYLKKNVSRSITDVISLLTVARTDDYIAEKLGIKINAVRRMLNIMQNYGITTYYISKNKNGWLSFAWYMNTSKLPSFLEYVRGVESERSMIEESCNDYFVCNNC